MWPSVGDRDTRREKKGSSPEGPSNENFVESRENGRGGVGEWALTWKYLKGMAV